MLFVDIDHRAEDRGRDVGVHGNRVIERDDLVVAVIAQETLPEDPRILIDHIGLPKSDVHHGLERHRVA